MKKFLIKISSVAIVAVMLCFSLTGCFLFGNESKLPAPEVVINPTGLAVWEKVDGAAYYTYIIDDGDELVTGKCSVQLKENQTIKVKAVSGDDEHADSDYSQPKTYVKSGPVGKLSVPEVVISGSGLAVWREVAGAHHYAYIIDNGAEQVTAKCSVQLQENQTIKVKAVSGDDEYADSDFSKAKTYIKSGPVGEHEHTDINSDGLCDICSESVTVELSFYAVNDLHGKFMDTSAQPGVDEFTTYIKNLYADDKREEILLSSGDMWQGTVESSTNKGRLMTEWMNDLGFVSMTLGNHEYDWGSDVLTPNSELANFPFLAINVTYNGKKVDYCKASTIVERGGVKIGIIGAIGNCLSSISGDFTTGLSFTTGSALTQLVKNESNRLRNQEGCDIIVYSIHDGGEGFESSGINSVTDNQLSYYETALSNGYVDIVFEAHTHQSYILKDEYGVYHLQGGGENSGISCADVSYNTATKSISVNPRIIKNGVYGNSSIEDDPVVRQLFDKYFPTSNPYTDVLGYNGKNRNSTAIMEQLAELYYQKGLQVWSGYNIVLGGGYLKARSPYNIYSGEVTYSDIFSVLPFDNEIVLGKVSGSNLQNLLSKSNYTMYCTIDSSSIVSSAYYYIIVDSYTSTYKWNNITEVARLGNETYPRDLLAEFISSGGWER